MIVTRPGEAGRALCAAIEAQFGPALHVPAIDFAPPDDEQAMQAAIKQAGEQDWLIFVSNQSVVAAVPAYVLRADFAER